MDSSPANFQTAPSTPNPSTPTPTEVGSKKWKVKRAEKQKKEKKAKAIENDAKESTHNGTSILEASTTNGSSREDDPPNNPLIPIHINNENINMIPLSTLVAHTGLQYPPVLFTLHRLTSPSAASHVLAWLAAQPTTPGPLPVPNPPITF